ncbi:hypothetical protein MANES_04G041334v8 [Manihot esculenta]|uniref:Uncharacterized protein n=2 Tax=Manihot esculenta TaxID=3983 RepID=A0ACB7HTJ7_MANES|nr:hypothetical protein MANES_08G128711v8 [Manihot esculenta]KAG8655471.1 hypothetical protein MANES_04G041334v8 [Manihot esculenta]
MTGVTSAPGHESFEFDVRSTILSSPPISSLSSPPSNTLVLLDITEISLLLSSADKNSLPPLDPPSSPTARILKRDWLHKHHTGVTAVVASLFISDHVYKFASLRNQ